MLAAILAASSICSITADAAGTRYKSWKQYSGYWSDLCLGTSGETVRQSGCAVVSAAMLMVKSGSVTDPDFNPGTIVHYLNQNGGFSADGDLYWPRLTSYAPSFSYLYNETLYGTQAQRAAAIESLVDSGYYVIAKVKYGEHFVAIDSAENGRVTMLDPASGAALLFDRYDASGVIELRVFSGANTPVMQAAPFPEQPDAPAQTDAPALPSDGDALENPPSPLLSASAQEELITLTDMPFLPNPPAPFLTEPAELQPAYLPESQPESQPEAQLEAPPAPFIPEASLETPVLSEAPASEPVLEAPPLPAEFLTQDTTPELAPAPMPGLYTAPETPALFQNDAPALNMQIRLSTTDALNLRISPDTSSAVLLVIPEGTSLTCTAFSGDGEWGQVSYNGLEGWISLRYTVM